MLLLSVALNDQKRKTQQQFNLKERMARDIYLDLLPHQSEFISDTTTRDLALVGGRGCGKTFSLCLKLITLAALNVGYVGAALSPTGPMASKVLIPEMLDALQRLEIKYDFNKTERRFELKFGNGITTIYILSAENVRDGLGLNLAFFGMDEADTMSAETAFEAWRKLKGALRSGNVRQSVAVSTPEGYGFMYRHWVKDITPENASDRRIIHGKGTDNIFLPEDFFDGLRATYPAHYLEAYINGQFTNMTSGSVYPDYSPEENHTNYTLATLPDNVKALHIGMDFNVVSARHPHGISIVTAVYINGLPYVIDEIYGASRTSDAIVMIQEKYPNYTIYVYPDASGASDKTSASVSDRTQLNAAGFIDRSPNGNPRVKDRVTAVNAMILDGNKNRRLRINKNTCPVLSACLVQQPYDPRSNEPQKDTGLDDPIDALGYLVNVNNPVKRSSIERQPLNV
jgi:hypothetical protein